MAVFAGRAFGGPPAAARRRLPPWLVGSLLFHLALICLLLFLKVPPQPQEPLPPPSVAMVFEGGRSAGPTGAQPAPFVSTPSPPNVERPPPPVPVPPTPAPEIAPAPTETPPAETPQPPQPPPPEAAPAPQPTAPSAAPEAPPPSAAPAIPIPPPVPAAPPPPLAAPIEPPVVHRAVPRPMVTRPAQPRVEAPPRQRNPFASPMDLSFGSTDRAPEAAQAPRASQNRQMSGLSLGPVTRGAFDLAPVGRGKNPGPDWRNELSAWIEAHKYYPQEAAMNGEDGTVVVRVVVERSGVVRSVELEDRSGSQWLDLAAQGMFRGAHLPPFPPDMTDPDFTFDLTMHYILIRR